MVLEEEKELKGSLVDYSKRCKVCGSNCPKLIETGIKDWEYHFPGAYSYYECGKCGTIQISPFPSIEDLIEAYRVDYHGFTEPSTKGILYKTLYVVKEHLSLRKFRKRFPSNARVLDVGCGIGLFLSELKAMGFTEIEGIDFSERAVSAVNSKGIKCFKGSFLDFCGEEKSYDLIAMNNYLEHTLNPIDEIKKAKKLLKNIGVLMGEIPNFGSLDRILFGRFWGGNHVPRHTFQFNEEKLVNVMRQAGFWNIRVSYPVNTSHFALSIQNFFQKDFECNNKPILKFGRARYYSILMPMLIPVDLINMFMKKTGFLKFEARP